MEIIAEKKKAPTLIGDWPIVERGESRVNILNELNYEAGLHPELPSQARSTRARKLISMHSATGLLDPSDQS